ncbi:MAG TPA: hypothetical protein VGC04_02465 [Cellulomonas sp.]
MSPFLSRNRVPPVVADVGDGFVATEAPALQQAIRSALRNGEGKGAVIPAEIQFTTGAAQRVVVEWRNRFVGFVPVPHLAALRGQLAGLGKGVLTAPGRIYHDGKYFRVWVGPLPEDGFPEVEAGYDELPEPPPSIFGIPLSRTPRDR